MLLRSSFQLNTALITPSQPPPLPGAGSISAVSSDDFSKPFLADLGEFLKKSKGCAEFLDNAITEIFNYIDPKDLDTPINILLSTVKFVDKTSTDGFGVVGRGLGNEDGSLGGTLPIYKDYLDWSKKVSSIKRGQFIFHEILHILYGGHRDVVDKLKITRPPYPQIPPQTIRFGRVSDAAWENYNRRRDGSDKIAADAMEDWINKGCKN